MNNGQGSLLPQAEQPSSDSTKASGKYSTPKARWAGIGPYYAMFPMSLPEAVITEFTNEGDYVLDPFAGRASSIFSAGTLNRVGIGIESSPVGWIYGQTKLDPAPLKPLVKRLGELCRASNLDTGDYARSLPEFFHACFTPEVLRFLCCCRAELDWRSDSVDRTLMTLILIDLHGKRSTSFSNQMRQGKAMSPDYSVRWWRERSMSPPERDPEQFLLSKIGWRYRHGTPTTHPRSKMILGDSTMELFDLKQSMSKKRKKFKLLLTSPPYRGVADYFYDQWLRSWMLGEERYATKTGELHKGKFYSKEMYEKLLYSVFAASLSMMALSGSTVYIRTDARADTLEPTRQVLGDVFNGWSLRETRQPFTKNTQTALFGDVSPKPGEIDIILSR